VLSLQRERNLRLRGRLDLLLGENEELHMKVADLKVSDAALVPGLSRSERAGSRSYNDITRGHLYAMFFSAVCMESL